ncbi:MAG: hypothetical protein H0W95_00535 [Nocardioidaceae bacterium]|nr:hypothetical protein [Nocardioidaceae bacterium]
MADFSATGRRRDWLPAVIAVVMLVAVLAVGGAWAVKTVMSAGPESQAADETVRMPVGGEGAPTGDGEPVGNTKGDGGDKSGSGKDDKSDDPAETLVLTSADASCTSAPGVDAAGEAVTYEPAAAIDADAESAWRCDGNGSGVRLDLALGQRATVSQVGLIPGYAKTDPVDGTDRYAENRRISEVTWKFDDGESVTQRFDTDPDNRSLQWTSVPDAETRAVEITIEASAEAARNTVAISTVQVQGTR